METAVERAGLVAEEAAEYLGLDVKTVYRMSRVPLSEGGIPCNWAGRTPRYSREGLDAWLTGRSRMWENAFDEFVRSMVDAASTFGTVDNEAFALREAR